MFFKKKKYHYFVSGICRNEPFMTEIILLKKVVSYDEIYRLTDELAKKYFSSKLLGDMKCWKNDRNKLVHNLMDAELDTRKLRGLALREKRLVAEFGRKVTLFNRAFNRRSK